jgi:hypothetical protein
MAWDDWDDDEPRPRRSRRFDVDDLRQGTRQSGAVTGAGVVTIIMGALSLLCGGGFGICGLFCAGAGAAARQQGNIIPPEMLENYGGFFLAWGLFHLALGVCLLIAGIVTLQRHNWGRTFALILAGIVACIGLVQFGFFIMVGMGEMGALFDNGDPDERIGQAVVGCMHAVIYLAYAIFVYIVLLNSHNKEEFD